MPDNTKQDQYREEDSMAAGPVSRGASNKSAPMNTNSPTSSTTDSDTQDQQNAPYDKMIRSKPSTTTQGDGMATNQNVGSPGGGSLPSGGPMGTGNPPGGMNTSNSTPSTGGSSGGAVAGHGSFTDRGKMKDTDMDATTNTEDELAQESKRRPNKKRE
jgi:hypothetical protein